MSLDEASGIKGDLIIHPVLEKSIFINKKTNLLNNKLNGNQPISNWIRNMLIKIKNENLKKELISEFKRSFDNFIEKL